MAIILVAWGHFYGDDNLDANRYLSFFRMPFFFLLSGYFFSTRRGVGRFLRTKWARLGIPYLSYLSLFTALIALGDSLGLIVMPVTWAQLGVRILKGGNYLLGPYGVFWFSSVLLLTHCTFLAIHLLGKRSKPAEVIGWLLLVSAALGAFWGRQAPLLPYSLEAVPIATCFYAVGFKLKGRVWWSGRVAAVAIAFAALSLIADLILDAGIEMNMKKGRYGVPGWNLLAGLAGAMMIAYFARLAGSRPRLTAVIASIGRASYTVMFGHVFYLHLVANPATVALRKHGAVLFATALYPVHLGLSVVLPALFHHRAKRHRWSRTLFLGDTAAAKLQ